MAMFRIVGGTHHTPEKSQTEPRRDLAACGRISFRAPDDAETLTITNRNKRLREQRYDVWRKAAAATCYWRAMLDLHHAISVGQDHGIPETSRHPPTTQYNWPLLENYRKAEVEQLLTPAPTVALVKWKQDVFAKGQYRFTDVKKERIEKAIADDLAFLASHAIRRVPAAKVVRS
jgi:hypothetical protein